MILTFTIAIFSLCCNIALAANSQVDEPTNNSVGITKPAQLPQELLAKFNTELSKLKAKAESQKTSEQTERMMRFYWQYKNAFDAMPTNSQIDVLNIFATGDDKGSKLKGIKLIDKAVEFVALLNADYSDKNAIILTKYNYFFKKLNKSSSEIISELLFNRLSEKGVNNLTTDEILLLSTMSLEESQKRKEDSEKLLKILLSLKEITTQR